MPLSYNQILEVSEEKYNQALEQGKYNFIQTSSLKMEKTDNVDSRACSSTSTQ